LTKHNSTFFVREKKIFGKVSKLNNVICIN